MTTAISIKWMQLSTPQGLTSTLYQLFDDLCVRVIAPNQLTCCNSSFNASSTPIIGRDGTSLQDLWDPTPEAYLSVCVPKIPNFFIYLGPNGGPASGSFIAMLEVVVEYIIKCVRKLQLEHISSMEVRYAVEFKVDIED